MDEDEDDENKILDTEETAIYQEEMVELKLQGEEKKRQHYNMIKPALRP